MFAKSINDKLGYREEIGSLVYAFINVFIIGCVKSAACWCWTYGQGLVEMMFFPLILAAVVMTVIAIVNLVREFWLLGGVYAKLALVYIIISFIVLAV